MGSSSVLVLVDFLTVVVGSSFSAVVVDLTFSVVDEDLSSLVEVGSSSFVLEEVVFLLSVVALEL